MKYKTFIRLITFAQAMKAFLLRFGVIYFSIQPFRGIDGPQSPNLAGLSSCRQSIPSIIVLIVCAFSTSYAVSRQPAIGYCSGNVGPGMSCIGGWKSTPEEATVLFFQGKNFNCGVAPPGLIVCAPIVGDNIANATFADPLCPAFVGWDAAYQVFRSYSEREASNSQAPSILLGYGQFLAERCPGGGSDIYSGESQHSGGSCVQKSADKAEFGNPIYPLNGGKDEVIRTGIYLANSELLLVYSAGRLASYAAVGKLNSLPFLNVGFGDLWISSFHKKIIIEPEFKYGAGAHYRVIKGDGSVSLFRSVGTDLLNQSGSRDRLEISGQELIFIDENRKTNERFSGAGQLLSSSDSNGGVIAYNYLTIIDGIPFLSNATDETGRAIYFEYEKIGIKRKVRISKITNISGQTILPQYDIDDRLIQLYFQDGRSRAYIYEDARHPWALTGIYDENASRYATFGYDIFGNAISTEHSGGVDKYSASYSTPPKFSVREDGPYRIQESLPPIGVVISDPNGNLNQLSPVSLGGRTLLGGSSKPAGSGCGSSNSASTFDSSGNVTSRVSFAGERSCFSYDTRRREVARVEGLTIANGCDGVFDVGAVLPLGARKISTQWHPDFEFSTVVTESGRKVSTVYHGQPDPFNGNTPANCTSATALPNGKLLPVVCKQVTQALLANGTVDTSVPSVVATSTYNAAGRILTSTDTAARTTAYAYYADTALSGTIPNQSGHTVGDLQTVTNPAGHMIQFTKYDASGRLLQSVDPNGVITANTYTPRSWIASIATTRVGRAASTSSYTYDAVGQLTLATSPDGFTVGYSYDAAHRLVGVTDSRGNSVTYTLDNMGNKVGEQLKDPQGVLQNSMSTVFDALNRVQQVTKQ